MSGVFSTECMVMVPQDQYLTIKFWLSLCDLVDGKLKSKSRLLLWPVIIWNLNVSVPNVDSYFLSLIKTPVVTLRPKYSLTYS